MDGSSERKTLKCSKCDQELKKCNCDKTRESDNMYQRSKNKNNWKNSTGSHGSSEKKKESPFSTRGSEESGGRFERRVRFDENTKRQGGSNQSKDKCCVM